MKTRRQGSAAEFFWNALPVAAVEGSGIMAARLWVGKCRRCAARQYAGDGRCPGCPDPNLRSDMGCSPESGCDRLGLGFSKSLLTGWIFAERTLARGRGM